MIEPQEQPDISVLLKSKKEHFEKETERLLAYFDEELRAADPFTIIGKRFREKEEKFSSLLKENKDLMIETRNLNDQIQRLRMSLRDSGRWEDERLSFDRTQRVESMVASKQEDTQPSYDEQLRSRLDHLFGAGLDKVREAQRDYATDLDRLIESVISYLTRDKAAQRLTAEIMESSQGEKDTIVVPRKRYEKLIEIYSINMSTVSIEKLRNEQPMMPKVEEMALNYIKQSNSTFQQKYCDITKGENVDVKDLYQLFRALAKKVGFEQEWDRYHRLNTETAVALKAQIDAIIDFKLLTEDQRASQTDNSLKSRELLMKVNKLMEGLPFDWEEKQQWRDLSDRINQDRLINMEAIVEKYREVLRQDTNILLEKMGSLASRTLAVALQEFTKVVRTRLKIKEADFSKDMGEVGLEALIADAVEKVKAGEQPWMAMEKAISERIKRMFKRIGKSFVFFSGNTLSHFLGGKMKTQQL